MRIVWIVNNINQVGGIEQVVCGQSNHFADVMNYEVEIVSINTFESNIFFPLSERVAVRHCGLDWRAQTRRMLGKVIRDLLSKLDADILITCHSPISIGVLLNKHRFKGKVIVTQHCACDFESKKRLLLNALMFRFADAFVVLTESDRAYYNRMGCRSVVIPNAIFSRIKARASLNDKILLSAGRLTAVKGFDLLIRAFAMVADKHPQWKLCICGNGEQADALVQQVESLGLSDRVTFPGFVRMTDYMCQAGCFAIPSRSEGFSLVLVEAMAHGLPIVAYELPAIKEICGSEGVLIAEYGSPADLANKLDALFSSDDLRYCLGQTSLEISKKYAVEAIAKRWEHLFNQLIK